MADRRRWRLAGVRARVTLLATALVFVVLAVSGAAITSRHHALLVSNLEETLGQAATELGGVIDAGERPPRVANFGDDDAAFQVVDAEGRVLASTANIAGAAPLSDAPTGGGETDTIHGLPHDSAEFLVLSRTVPSPAGPVVLHVATTLDDIEESTGALGSTMAAAVPLVTAILAVAIWFVVGRTLRPVEAIRTEVATIGGGDLHRRVPIPRSDDEVARLARTMNEMLERVERATARQQRFVADASHELRSPLTRIRTELEVDLAHPGLADPLATHRSVLDEAVGLQQVVEDLLHLARVDAGAEARAMVPVALHDLVAGATDDVRSTGTVTVDTTAVDPAMVDGRPEQLRRLLANLLENAVRHARSVVRIELTDTGDRVGLTVIDDGPGIAPGDRERIFERFTRLDDARRAADGGTGLGLAIVREIAQGHGGSVVVADDGAAGARLVVTLPRSTGSQSRTPGTAT